MIDTRQRTDSIFTKPAQLGSLIGGTFAESEARDLVRSLTRSCRQFLGLRNLSAQVHCETPDDEACRSMARLEELGQRLEETLRLARERGQSVRLEGDLRIELVESRETEASRSA